MFENRDRLTKSSTLSAGVLLVAALVGIINYFGWKYYQRFDWTRSELYSLSERSSSLLTTLDQPIEATVFMGPENSLFGPVVELLSRYEAASSRFTSRIVDPAKNPLEAQTVIDRFELSQIDVIVVESDGERRIIESADLAEYDYSGLQFGQGPELTGFKGEQAITGAILELIEDERTTVLFTTGHGELELDEFSSRGLSQLADLLQQDNLEVEEWQSLGALEVPTGTALVVVAGPTTNFVQPEIEALEGYLAAGGRLLILLDPILGEDEIRETGLEALVETYGVEIGADIVVDPSNPVPFFGAETIFVDTYGTHPTTKSLDQARVPVILPLARSVGRLADSEADLEVTELMTTSPDGWGERDLDRLDRVEFGAGDRRGPVPVAVAVAPRSLPETPADESLLPESEAGHEAETKPEAAGTRLVVVGDADFASNGQLINVGNTEMVLGVVNWLVERETLIGIPAKSPDQVRLTLTSAQLRAVAWMVFGGLPGVAILVGMFVFLKRRR